jgi:hypothetical protein
MRLNSLTVLSFVILSLNCKTKAENSIEHANLKKVEIRFVNLSITTPVHVECNDFANYFDQSQIQTRVFTTSQEWSELVDQLNALAAEGEKSNNTPDVRMTIEFHYTDAIRWICVGNILTSINGASYLNSSSFRDFITTNFQE